MISVLVLFVVLSVVYGKQTVVDLSQQHKPGLVAYPPTPDLNFTIMSRGIRKDIAGRWVEYNKFETFEHYGTHVDVPAHVKRDMWRLHQVPVDHFVGPAVVIDVTERAKTNPDTEVMVSDLLAWEEKYGEIPEGAMVLMRSGWDKKFSNINDYFGTSTPRQASSFHYPGFSAETTKWLVENRPKFNGIGVDTISLDHGPSRDFQAHVNLFTGNKIGYENLANLERLPEAGAMFYAVPINLYDGSGCPVRAVGIIDDGTGGSQKTTQSPVVIIDDGTSGSQITQSPVGVTDDGTSGSQKITQSIALTFIGIALCTIS